MKKRKVIINAVFTGLSAIVLVLVSGCFFSAPMGKLVKPAIRAIGLPDASVVGSVSLKVTGPDMDPVEVSYSTLPSVINISIPEGTDRQFELTVKTGSSYTGPVASYKGTATADVTSDSAVVTLTMGIGSTKIIVPDTYNFRLVQINDMSGNGWATLQGSQMVPFGSTNSNFQPVDVDYDQYGNIYVANSNSIYTGIYRFASIADTVPVPVLKPSTVTGMTAVALDRANNRIYGLYGTSVIWSDYAGSLTGGTTFNYTSFNLSVVNGITVDEEGYVYLCGQDANSELVIEKYSKGGGSPVKFYVGATGTPAMDVTILNGVLYTSVYFSVSSPTIFIEAFDPDTLQPVAGSNPYGAYSSSPSKAGEFYGPHKFIATLNNKITVMDFDSYNVIGSRLVSFDDILGAGWTTYGSYGGVKGEFMFSGGQ